MSSKKQKTVDYRPVFEAAGLGTPLREIRFHPVRRWRWDYAWLAERVALEIQGGSWTGGRHTRGSGYAADCEKLAEGQLAGWLVIWATPGQVNSGEAIAWLERALAGRRHGGHQAKAG